MKNSDFRHILTLPIRWGDMDALKHVNNVQYFRYFESGRIAYFTDLFADGASLNGNLVLADIQCTFLQQLNYPGDIDIGTRIIRIGNSSIALECGIFLIGQQQPVACGKGVMVWYDFVNNHATRVPDDIRQTILLFENGN